SGRNWTRPATPSLNRTKRLWLASGLTSTTSQCMESPLQASGSIFTGGVFSRQKRQSSNNSSLCIIAHPDQIQCPARQLAIEYLQSADLNGGLELTISSVKVWRRVVIEKHPD